MLRNTSPVQWPSEPREEAPRPYDAFARKAAGARQDWNHTLSKSQYLSYIQNEEIKKIPLNPPLPKGDTEGDPAGRDDVIVR